MSAIYSWDDYFGELLAYVLLENYHHDLDLLTLQPAQTTRKIESE